ncbi:MAG: HisA/HisF-related TIM barrel protein [Candidatus Limnocylindria bacterium]
MPSEPPPIPRVIPCLLIEDEVMVKTIRYADPTYLGDPINVINLFNRFEVDEITLLDIGATRAGVPPPIELLEQLAAECWVPLAYGGGIRSLEHVRSVLGCGIEKVVLGTIVADQPALITQAAEVYGSQAVVVSVDARQRGDGYEVAVASTTRGLGIGPVDYAQRAQQLGAGEILLNAVDRDGTMEGYDIGLIGAVAEAVEIPVIACGGAGERAHLANAIRAGASAVAAGSIFVYRGRERGVLINFPERAQLEAMLG